MQDGDDAWDENHSPNSPIASEPSLAGRIRKSRCVRHIAARATFSALKRRSRKDR
jgi:hypothetical protein